MFNIRQLTWPAPPHVKAYYTLRTGGMSQPPYKSFNLGDHVGDSPPDVASNRRQLLKHLQLSEVTWLTQVHGVDVADLDHLQSDQLGSAGLIEADACTATMIGRPCCVMTADCLPVFFCDLQGRRVALAHAGWRGLLGGVLQKTLSTFEEPSSVMAYMGPAIGAQAFEVGDDLRMAFLCHNAAFNEYFEASPNSQRWMGDLYAIARHILHALGVNAIYGGDHCTYTEKSQFFSYRRDGTTGRMANLIWLEE
ncbi:peptidoglycan editing factor PgeF [Eionea flava]